jgi:hypothetical protein
MPTCWSCAPQRRRTRNHKGRAWLDDQVAETIGGWVTALHDSAGGRCARRYPPPSGQATGIPVA